MVAPGVWEKIAPTGSEDKAGTLLVEAFAYMGLMCCL